MATNPPCCDLGIVGHCYGHAPDVNPIYCLHRDRRTGETLSFAIGMCEVCKPERWARSDAVTTLLTDDLVTRLISADAADLPCASSLVMYRCSGHFMSDDEEMCWHLDPTTGYLTQPRLRATCSTCQPERWVQSTNPGTTPPTPDILTESQTVALRPEWDAYFFEIARVVATRATCPRAAIGVVLVDRRHRILATGFNGAPSGEPHCTEVGCRMFAGHCTRATHGEENAVKDALERLGHVWEGNPSREPSTPLASLEPIAYIIGPRVVCSHCARVLVEAGVKEVKTQP